MTRGRFSKVFVGWWMNIIASVLTGFAMTFAMQGASALFTPISEEFSLTRAEASAPSGITAVSNGVGFLLAGLLSDRYGSRRIIVLGTLITSLSMLILGASPNHIAYFTIWGVSSVGISLGYTIAVDALVTNWFRRRRGLAFSVRFAVIGVVSSITLPIFNWLISTEGWRVSVMVWGAVLISSLPLLIIFLKEGGPEEHGLLPDGDSSENCNSDISSQQWREDFNVKEIFRTPAYWILTIAYIFYTVIFQGINTHIIPALMDMGIDPVTSGSLLAITTLSMIPSRLFSGFIADHIKPSYIRFMMAASLLIWASSMVAYLLMPTMTGVYILLIFWGFGSGAYIPLDLILRSKLFGRGSFGKQQGISSMVSAPFTFFAPIYIGWMHDITGSYTTPFKMFTFLTLISTFIICLAKPPKKRLINL